MSPTITTRFLFLDIDGVCNSAQWYTKGDKSGEMLEPELIERVNEIVNKSKCKVILSSVWRLGKNGVANTQESLNKMGAKFIICDRTPRLPSEKRGIEIQKWMDNNKVTEDQIVILDDDSDMEHLSHRLVQTKWATGIQPGHVEKTLRLFNAHR